MKKDSSAKIDWHTEDRLLYLPIDFIIKKEIFADPHAFGVIYIQGEPIEYSHGNLSDIVSHKVLGSSAKLVQRSIRYDGSAVEHYVLIRRNSCIQYLLNF